MTQKRCPIRFLRLINVLNFQRPRIIGCCSRPIFRFWVSSVRFQWQLLVRMPNILLIVHDWVGSLIHLFACRVSADSRYCIHSCFAWDYLVITTFKQLYVTAWTLLSFNWIIWNETKTISCAEIKVRANWPRNNRFILILRWNRPSIEILDCFKELPW